MKRKIYHIGHYAPPPGNGRDTTTGDNTPQVPFSPFAGNSVRNALLGYVAPAGVWFKRSELK